MTKTEMALQEKVDKEECEKKHKEFEKYFDEKFKSLKELYLDGVMLRKQTFLFAEYWVTIFPVPSVCVAFLAVGHPPSCDRLENGPAVFTH